jgi:hypothetical protein
MVYFKYKKTNTMGQIKTLLDNIFEFELDESTYPDDLHMDYEIWVLQKEAEKAAYEELLADTNK